MSYFSWNASGSPTNLDHPLFSSGCDHCCDLQVFSQEGCYCPTVYWCCSHPYQHYFCKIRYIMYNIQGTLVNQGFGNLGFKFDLFLKGDILFSDVANFIPTLAIFYALVSSLNSVGVSIYQEQLFKVSLFLALFFGLYNFLIF